MKRYLLLLLTTGLVASCDSSTSPDQIPRLVPRHSNVPAGTRVELYIPAQLTVPSSTTKLVVKGFTAAPIRLSCQSAGDVTLAGELSGVMTGADGGPVDGVFASQELSPRTKLGLLELRLPCESSGSMWTAEVL